MEGIYTFRKHSIAFHNHILVDDDSRLDPLLITPHDIIDTNTARSVFTDIAPKCEYCRVVSIYELLYIN